MKFKYLLFTIIISTSLHAQQFERINSFKNDSAYISFVNPFPTTVVYKFKISDSLKTKIKSKAYAVLRERDTVKNAFVIPLSMITDTTKVNVSEFGTFKGQFGDPNSKPNLNYLYTLPWQKGRKYKIIQGFNGKFSHSSKHSKYAYDFSTQIGDTIVAARSGKVIFTKDDSKEQGYTRKAMGKANKIIVVHDDGTFGHYVHLDYDGVMVEIGDNIKEGQNIGISGFTGFTTTPHLHFVVMKYGSESIPIYFKGYEGKKLKRRKKYKRFL